MRIKSELLWGESIRDKSKIYDLLLTEKLPSGYFLLLCTEGGQLEIVSAKMQFNKYYLSRECLVFGIAHGKKEAYSMIEDIMHQIFIEHKYESVKEFAGEVLGEPLC